MRVARSRQHTRALNRTAERDRGNSTERGYDADWQRLRAAYLSEHPLCVTCEREGETVPAQDVDHIQAFSGRYDPSRLDWWNLQGLCRRHHNQKTHGEKTHVRVRTFAANIIIVAGKPGSGKTTYVRRHKEDGDLVWDLDDVAKVIGGGNCYPHTPQSVPVLLAMRDAFLSSLGDMPRSHVTAWVIITDTAQAKLEAAKYGGECIVCPRN